MTDFFEQVKEALEDATPGPWVAADSRGPHPYVYVSGPEQNYEWGKDRPIVAYAPGIRDKANARLIALAPEMARVVLGSRGMAHRMKVMVGIAGFSFASGLFGGLALTTAYATLCWTLTAVFILILVAGIIVEAGE